MNGKKYDLEMHSTSKTGAVGGGGRNDRRGPFVIITGNDSFHNSKFFPFKNVQLFLFFDYTSTRRCWQSCVFPIF